jgi:hypothetical protein
MPGHPADRDQVQRRVRLPVAATAQPMPGGLAFSYSTRGR